MRKAYAEMWAFMRTLMLIKLRYIQCFLVETVDEHSP